MKKPSYSASVTGIAINAITFWRYLPEAAGFVLREAFEVCDAIISLAVRLIAVGLVIIVPAFVLLSPLTGLVAYRRAKRRYEAGQ